MSNPVDPGRDWSGALRLLSSTALLVFAVAVFHRPVELVLGPQLQPVIHTIETGGLDTGGWFAASSAKGFMLQVASNPSGAEVLVNGQRRTQTPAIANVECRDGEEVLLTLRLPGYNDFETTVPCREEQSLRMRIRLEPTSP